MLSFRGALFILSALLAVLSATTPASATVSGRAVMYYTSWSTYARNYQVAQIPADKLTHINYAFANIDSVSGTCILGDPYADTQKTFAGDRWDQALAGNFNQLQLLKQKHPHLKTLLSVGGWTWSTNFPMATATAAARANLVTSCITLMRQYAFDGLDIDWEYPTAQTSAQFTATMQEFRNQLNVQATADGVLKYELTIAAPAGKSNYQLINWPALNGVVDYVNVMTYDYNGGWDLSRTAHNAPIYDNNADPSTDPHKAYNNVDASLRDIISLGYDPTHLVMGMPFYGRIYAGVSAGPNNNGLFQPAGWMPMGTWEAGVLDYKDIVKTYLPNAAWHQYRDAVSKVPFLYNANLQQFISYDDVQSFADKCVLAKQLNLAGMMTWDLSSDNGDLVNAVAACINFTRIVQPPLAQPSSTVAPIIKTSAIVPAQTSTKVLPPPAHTSVAPPMTTSTITIGGCSSLCGTGDYVGTGVCQQVALLGGERCTCTVGWSGPNALFLAGKLYADHCSSHCMWTNTIQAASCGYKPGCSASARRDTTSEHDGVPVYASTAGLNLPLLAVVCMVFGLVALSGFVVSMKRSRQHNETVV